LLFEAALGIEADMWIRIQADYNMQTVRKNESFSERLAKTQKVVAML
jgi:plasmid maintenance system antidote protein VapI